MNLRRCLVGDRSRRGWSSSLKMTVAQIQKSDESATGTSREKPCHCSKPPRSPPREPPLRDTNTTGGHIFYNAYDGEYWRQAEKKSAQLRYSPNRKTGNGKALLKCLA
jgi:hypothetical protein